MKVGYVVSRFPAVSEVWIVREMDAVERNGVEISLFALFGGDGSGVVHESADRWLARVRVGTPGRGLRALAWWFLRRPLRTLSTIVLGTFSYLRRPEVFVKSGAAIVLGTDLARAAQRNGIVHIHAHFATYPALAAWTIRRLTGIPYSFTAHAHDLYIHQLHLAQKAQDAQFVVPISEFNRRLLQGLGVTTPLVVIHCGVGPDMKFAERPAPNSDPIALCVASLQEYKGQRYLLAALREPGLENLRLRLVGGGPEHGQLEQTAVDLGVRERVDFTGPQPESRVHDEIAQADVFVLPSIVAPNGDTEGIPVVLMEAMAAGLPVIATAVAGVPELVRDGETGLTVSPGDPSALAGAIREIFANWAAAQSRARQARALVESDFDAERSGETLARLFRTSQPH